MRLLHPIAALLAAAMGFLFALALIALLELLSGEFWVVGVAVLVLVAGVVLYETLTERLIGCLARRLFGIAETEAEVEERRVAALSRYAAAAGVVAAFVATRVWTAPQILGMF